MLEVANLVAGYGKVQVLHGISLKVEQGQLVTLIGSNGAGKTTTLRVLSGMVAPMSGSVTLAGAEIGGLPTHAITRRGLAHSPEGRRVFATLSVADNLQLGAFARLTGARPRGDVEADRNRMYELFPRLKERRSQLAGTLSGGEQQMLAMARALMLHPQVLHGISLRVEQGQLVTLIGSNGAGKTTTLRVLSGMVAPASGSVMLGGVEIAGLPTHAITRKGLAHSPEGRRVFGTLSVADNLQLGAFPRLTGSRARGDVEADRGRMYELFPRLKERRNQLAGTLSGGEQQMLAMARALMLDPEVLLLDEPSMGLAPKLVEEVFSTIARLKAAKVTMLLVEQFAAAALDVADFGYVMENGRLSASGPAAALKNDPAVRAAYLGAAH